MKNTMTEEKWVLILNGQQLMLIANCLDDLHRFASGDIELYYTRRYLSNNSKELKEKLKALKPLVTPELENGQLCYDWAGNHCPNEQQREFIAQTYYLYREILHRITEESEPLKGYKSMNVYSNATLRCALSGEPINLIKIK